MNKPLILIALLTLCVGAASADDQCSDDSGQQGQQSSQGACYGDDGSGKAGAGADAAPGAGTSDKELDGLNCLAVKTDSMVNRLTNDVVGKLREGSTSVVNKGSEATGTGIAEACGSGKKDLEGAKAKLKCVPGGIDKLLATLGKIRAGLQGRRGHETTTNSDFGGATGPIDEEERLPENEQETTKPQRDLLRKDNGQAKGKASCQQGVNSDEESAVAELEQVLNDIKAKTGDDGSVSKFNSTSQAVLKADGDGAPISGIYSCLGAQKTYQSDSTTEQPADGAATQGQSPKERFKNNLSTVDQSFATAQNEVKQTSEKLKALTKKLTGIKGRLPCSSVAGTP